MTPEKRRDASFKFQLVCYRRNLNRNGGAEIRLTLRQTSARSTSQLNDCGRLFFNRLCKGAKRIQVQRTTPPCALSLCSLLGGFSARRRLALAEFELPFFHILNSREIRRAKLTVVCCFSRFLTSES